MALIVYVFDGVLPVCADGTFSSNYMEELL
jgi:hypothetical protein